MIKQVSKYKTILVLVLVLTILPTKLIFAETISSAKAIEDAEYLSQKLETVHPNLYFGTPKWESKNRFQGIIETIEGKDKWTKRELYRLLAPFVASFQDGHTFLSINQEFLKYADNGGRVLPLMVGLVNGKLLVAGNLSGRNPVKGEEIISVNGKDAGEIYGSTIDLIGVGLQSFVEAKASRNFPVFYHFLNGLQSISPVQSISNKSVRHLTGKYF